jgi:hypothetical protein
MVAPVMTRSAAPVNRKGPHEARPSPSPSSIVDFVSFIIPLGSLTIAWIIVTRPQWAIDFVDRLSAEDPGKPDEAAKGPPDARPKV